MNSTAMLSSSELDDQTLRREKPPKNLAVSPWFLEAGNGATFSTPPAQEFHPRPYSIHSEMARILVGRIYIAILGEINKKKVELFFFPIRLRCRSSKSELKTSNMDRRKEYPSTTLTLLDEERFLRRKGRNSYLQEVVLMILRIWGSAKPYWARS